jgi:hypothetical protein
MLAVEDWEPLKVSAVDECNEDDDDDDDDDDFRRFGGTVYA